MSKGIFITGTGTDIGKTYVTGLLLKKLTDSGLQAAYYKAAMSGNKLDTSGKPLPGDAILVSHMGNLTQPLESMCPYVYENAYSPHLAARLEGTPVELAVVQEGYLKLAQQYEYITVEGSGGILCPINYDTEKIFLSDIIRTLNLNCILIADAGLGTINSVVLTAEYMQNHGLLLKGIIFNNYHTGNIMEDDNIRMCHELTGLPVLAKIAPGAESIDMTIDALTALYDEVK